MIKRLKWNFVLLNMALVTLVLLLVFGFIYINSANELRLQGERALESSVQFQLTMDPLRPPVKRNPAIFGFTYTFDGEIANMEGISDYTEEDFAEIAQEILERDLIKGELGSYDLRYLVYESEEGLEMDFLDISIEKDFLNGFLLTLVLIGVATLSVFFAISLFLASRMIRPVERSWTMQRRFVSDASHELRTPLTVILANTSLLLKEEEGTQEETKREWIGYINEEAKRMKKLVEDLLFLARTDEQRQRAIVERFNLSELAYEVSLMFEPIFFDKKIDFQVDIQDGLAVMGDRDQIKQAILILLDNAYKYAPDGESVFLKLVRKGRIELSVRNTGSYIDADKINLIFDRFYKLDEARTRGTGSFGLGLAIAQEIATLHQGSLRAASDPQQGTVFTLQLKMI